MDLFTGCFVCGVWMNHVWALALAISGFSVFTRVGASKPQKSTLEKRGADDICTMWPGHFVFVVLCVARGRLCFCPPISVGRPVFMVKLFSEFRAPSLHNPLYYS